MGNFRSNNRNGFGGRSGGSRFGGRSRGGRDSERFGRRPVEMFDVTCSKCGKRCQVPFKPTGSKPVFCSDCFRQNEGSGDNFSSRNQGISSQSGASSQQLNQINIKLDKILLVLQNLELDIDEDSEEDMDEDFEEDSDDDSEDESEENIDEDSEDESVDETDL